VGEPEVSIFPTESLSKAVTVESQISTWLLCAGVMQGPDEGNEVLCRGCFQQALGNGMTKMPDADKIPFKTSHSPSLNAEKCLSAATAYNLTIHQHTLLLFHCF